jgi:hypothetical protein
VDLSDLSPAAVGSAVDGLLVAERETVRTGQALGPITQMYVSNTGGATKRREGIDLHLSPHRRLANRQSDPGTVLRRSPG